MQAFWDQLLFNFSNYSELTSTLYILTKYDSHGLQNLCKIVSKVLGKTLTFEFLQRFVERCKIFGEFYPLDFPSQMDHFENRVELAFKECEIEIELILPDIEKCVFCEQLLKECPLKFNSAT
jgi:hypothetical protein